MAHILAKLTGYKMEEIKRILEADAIEHAQEKLFLEYIWQNADDSDEVFFLFKTLDLNHSRLFINRVHAEAIEKDPNVKLPVMTYLE